MTNKKRLRWRKSVRDRLPALLERYIEKCRPPGANRKSGEERLPNLAGFCRFIGCGMEDFALLQDCDPGLYGRLMAILEDELLNFSPSPAILGTYLKRRLDYTEGERERSSADCGAVQLIFEHDIEADGA